MKNICYADSKGVTVAKEALDTLLQGEVTPWAQQGSGLPAPLPKKKTDHEWAVAGGFPNLEEEYNRSAAHVFGEIEL